MHLRRATGQGWDGFLHPHPRATPSNETARSKGGAPGSSGAVVGIAVLFNPTNRVLTETVGIPLYYTGLSTTVRVSINDAAPVSMALGMDYFVFLALKQQPTSTTTILFTVP